MNRLCLIAGIGELPKIIAKGAQLQGYKVIAIALEDLADRGLSLYVDEIKWVNVGRFGEIIDSLKRYEVKEAVMAGKVPKSLLYKSNITPDSRALKLLSSLKDKSDDSILLAISEEIEKEGINLLDITSFTLDLLAPEGVLTKDGPTADEWKDISFGFRIAKELGRLDIGQSVVVKNQAVMAVEAVEGTDEAIKRGGMFAGKGAVVVKVSKPQQNMRFEVPAVGLNTLKTMIEVSARVLAIESGKIIVLDKDSIIEEANKAGVTVVGVKDKFRI